MDLLSLVKKFEGFSRTAYLCPAGYWTIGYGHLCTSKQLPISEPTASKWLEDDLAVARGAVLRGVTTPLFPHQIDALTSWTFNLGGGRFRSSTLRKVINRNELDQVPHQMKRWVYAGGQVLSGLVRRRQAEVDLWHSIKSPGVT